MTISCFRTPCCNGLAGLTTHAVAVQLEKMIIKHREAGCGCLLDRSLFLPARASEQGNVIGLVSVYIYIYIYIYDKKNIYYK